MKMYLKNANIIFIVYDWSNMEPFQYLALYNKWVNNLK